MATRNPSSLLDRSDARDSAPNAARTSRFAEQQMREYTPASSVYGDGNDGPDERHVVRERSLVRMALRTVNGCLHATSCLLLVTIAGSFLHDARGVWYGQESPQAVVILLFTGIDIMLDFAALIRLRKKWPGWALLLRLLLGIGYLVVFVVYMAMDHVFPLWFSCWGLDHTLTAPMVYLFLWLTGIWNLLHATIHRHRLSEAVQSYTAFALSPFRRTRPEDAGTGRRSQGDRRSGGRPSAWRRMQNLSPGDVEHNRAARAPNNRDNILLSVISEEVVQDGGKTASLKTEEAGDTGERPAPLHVPLGEIKL